MTAAVPRAIAALLLTVALSATLDAQAATGEYEMRFGVRIPVRGGDTLHATLYLPKHRPRRVPLILTMSPYTSDTYHSRGAWYARHGYLFAAVDVRGRGNSTGRFDPFRHDADDGYDAVEFLAQLPECDGQVGMWGGSYGGFAQWATAGRHPPHLRTIVPAAAVYPGHDFPTLRGIPFLAAVRWLAETGGRTANNRWGEDDAFWNGAVRRMHSEGRSLRALDTLSGFPSTTFQEWLDHPTLDAYWAATLPTAEQLAQIEIPVLTITGYYDVDQPGALRFYREHRSAAPQSRHHLLLGPWDHAGTRTPAARFSGVVMGPRSALSLDSLLLGWYDHVMRDGPLPTLVAAPVRYYRTGTDRWDAAPSLDALTASHLGVALGQPGSRSRTGTLMRTGAQAAGRAWRASIRYEPADTTRLARDLRTQYYDYGSSDRLTALGTEALTFETAPSGRAMQLAGLATLALQLGSDAPEADVSVDLYVVRPDRSTVWLTGDMRRVEFSDSLPKRVEFESLNVFEREVGPRDRLRLVVTTPHLAIFAPSGGGNGAPSRSRPVVVEVRHSPEAPSVLTLPLARNALP